MEANKDLHSKNVSDRYPQEPSAAALEELTKKYVEANQEHVFSFYESLTPTEKASLFAQLSSFDPKYINKITDDALNSCKKEQGEGNILQPLYESLTASIIDSRAEDIEKWYNLGLDLIAQNKVAVILLAGGQGTRLGSSAPKGCFDIGLPSRKSLFQLQGERIKKIQELALAKVGGITKIVVPWYVMTSGPTRGPTESYFKHHSYFGLEEQDVKIFEQGVIPCISNEGKILLESKGRVSVAPDGNGGIYQALVVSGILLDMRNRGIEHVHAYCVDNCQVKVADPVFIGFSASKKVDIATKVVRKRSASEPVGLIVLKNGKPGVVEYSEIDKETAAAMDTHYPQLLKLRAANIVNHYYSLSFLETIPYWAHQLSYHVARKKIPHVDTQTGDSVRPEKPNGIKLEKFVFDCFSMVELEKFACLEVKREEEFSPLKNAKHTGEDDPDTSRRDILKQGQRWARAAGATLASETNYCGLEISPLISYAGEGLECLKGKTITVPVILKLEDLK